MNLQQIARSLGGVAGNGQVLAPGPGHSKHDRSMSVFIDPNAPDLIRVHSHAGDDWRACRDYVKARLSLDDCLKPRPMPVINRPAKPKREDSDRTAFALALWHDARPITGTPASAYLASRGVDLGGLREGIGEALRWHPACPWEGGRHGAMIGLMTDVATGEMKAVHRTAVTPLGQKVGKKMLGPAAGCLVRIWPDEAVTNGLVVGEGIETSLVAATRIEHRGTRLAPVWAACSAGTMSKLPVLAGVECLTLLVDNDESGTGERAALECSKRWTTAGHEVIRLKPASLGSDFADFGSEAA